MTDASDPIPLAGSIRAVIDKLDPFLQHRRGCAVLRWSMGHLADCAKWDGFHENRYLSAKPCSCGYDSKQCDCGLAALLAAARDPVTEKEIAKCLTCGHQHYFEDDADSVPWGICRECPCKAPNYNPHFQVAARDPAVRYGSVGS